MMYVATLAQQINVLHMLFSDPAQNDENRKHNFSISLVALITLFATAITDEHHCNKMTFTVKLL